MHRDAERDARVLADQLCVDRAFADGRGRLKPRDWRCRGKVALPTTLPGPGVTSTGLRRMWRHGSCDLHVDVALEGSQRQFGEPLLNLAAQPHALAPYYATARESA